MGISDISVKVRCVQLRSFCVNLMKANRRSEPSRSSWFGADISLKGNIDTPYALNPRAWIEMLPITRLYWLPMEWRVCLHIFTHRVIIFKSPKWSLGLFWPFSNKSLCLSNICKFCCVETYCYVRSQEYLRYLVCTEKKPRSLGSMPPRALESAIGEIGVYWKVRGGVLSQHL